MRRELCKNAVSKRTRQQEYGLQEEQWENLQVLGEFVLENKMSGLFVWYPRVYIHKHTHTPKHRHKNTHTQVTAVAGCAAFCHLPGFPTPVLNVNSFILLYLEEVGEWWGEQKHQTTKKVPNNTAIFAASTAAVSFSSPSSSSLSLPLCPPFHIHTPA